jgi:ferric-dicitrate binding protein FerR (iron transport regulator)
LSTIIKPTDLNQHDHTPIDDLLVKHLLRETSSAENRVVEEWLAETPANRHYYQQLQLIWEKSLHLTPSTLIESAGDEEKAWQTLRQKFHTPSRPKPVIPLPWAAAAAAAILLPILFLTFFGWPGQENTQVLSSNNIILRDTLPDGTTITLNTHSTLTHSRKFKHRNVELQGEAFFQVAADRDRPFQLAANGISITVLGTAFNVRTDSATTDITVETGRIRVTNRHGAIELGAGESLTLGPDDSRPQKHPSPTVLHHYFHPRVFECHDTPLGQLTDALQEAYGVHILIADPVLRQQKLNVSFHDESLDRILSVLTETLNLTSTRKGDSIILNK